MGFITYLMPLNWYQSVQNEGNGTKPSVRTCSWNSIWVDWNLCLKYYGYNAAGGQIHSIMSTSQANKTYTLHHQWVVSFTG
jgi:hypothetical protein